MSIYNRKRTFEQLELSSLETKAPQMYFQDPANMSPFSLSSPDDSGFHYSCEDLVSNFDNTDLNNIQDVKDDNNVLSSVANLTLENILQHFPELPSFILHSQFPIFANLWLGFQKHTALAKEHTNRSYVQSWLTSTALQIHYHMVTLVKTASPKEQDPESSSRKLFSAFRRLKDRIEIMHEVFEIIERGRTIGQSPTEAIAPLVDAAAQIRKEVSYFKQTDQVIPVIDKDAVNLMRPDEVSMTDLSNSLLDTYNLMPYNNSSTTAAKNFIYPSTTTRLEQETYTSPVHVPYSHIQPSWMHYPSESLPATPSYKTHQYSQFMSLPNSPNCYSQQQAYSVQESVGTPANTIQTLSPYQSNSPLNTFSEINPTDEESSDMDIDECKSTPTIKEEDEEYVVSDCAEDEDWQEPSRSRKRSKRIAVRKANNRNINVVTARRPVVFEKQYTRRTATSYDAETTHYLKSVFFDIYSNRDKLTKEQRRQVQRETGLKPRNITYWFSNHKRRFQNSLQIFKKIVNESKGTVKNYNDFLVWRRSRGFSEDVLENEHKQILESLDNSPNGDVEEEEEEDVTV